MVVVGDCWVLGFGGVEDTGDVTVCALRYGVHRDGVGLEEGRAKLM